MPIVSIEEKLKLQVANIGIMLKEHRAGKDISTMMYWQMEHLHEVLESVETITGADKVRERYASLEDL